MKKLIIIMLSVFMLFALASCEQGLTEEEAEALANQRAEAALKESYDTLDEFSVTYTRFNTICNLFVDKIAKSHKDSANKVAEYTITLSDLATNSGTDSNPKWLGDYQLEYLYDSILNNGPKGTILNVDDITDIEVKSGTVSGEYKSSSYNITITNVKVTFKYTLEDDTTDTKYDGSITANGTVSLGISDEGAEVKSGKFTLNDTNYDISFERGGISFGGGDATTQFISAKINGKDVDLKLINSVYYMTAL